VGALRWCAASTAVGLLLSQAPSASGADADEAAALVRHAADAHTESAHGVVVFDVTTHTEIRGAGLYRRDDVQRAAYVVVDGKLAHKRVLQLTEGRHIANADELQRASAKPDGALSRLGMRLPYSAQDLGAYTFDPPRAEGSETVIAFRTTARDEVHGDGTLTLDAERRIANVLFRPAKLPEHASGAAVTGVFGPVPTGRWDITGIVRVFSGRLGFFTGHVVATSVYEAYRTFATAELARAAIDRE